MKLWDGRQCHCVDLTQQFTAGLNAHETLFNTKTCQVKNLKSNRETISLNCLAGTGFRLQSDL